MRHSGWIGLLAAAAFIMTASAYPQEVVAVIGVILGIPFMLFFAGGWIFVVLWLVVRVISHAWHI